ncbi:MAG: AraC family transcriptional regulator, partial [Kiritimatiellae bacterium]|nr:AraC family transcriptional regulator [Kiritimatiellia bacterium]
MSPCKPNASRLPGAPAPIAPAPWRRIVQGYRGAFGLTPVLLAADGASLDQASDPLAGIEPVTRARGHAIAESLRWGESYVFLMADGVLSWAVALVDGEELRGGICGGEVTNPDAPLDVQAAVLHLSGWGRTPDELRRHLQRLPAWPQSQVQAAADALYSLVYGVLGWRPTMLRRNRADAIQQREIAEAIHQGKRDANRVWPFAEERRLLLLIRAGDHNAARKHLNNLLAGMFLDTPRLPLLQARALELLGYLVRVAIEDSPSLVPLIESHHGWMARVIGATSFDEMCRTVRDALDDFMVQVAQQGVARTNLHVRRALALVTQHPERAVSLEEAARAAGVSRYRLAHLVKSVTGQTFLQHVQRVRIAEACRRLETTTQSGAGIAAGLGFSDQSHFIRVFKQVVGVTPARYRGNRLPAGMAPSGPETSAVDIPPIGR